MGALEPEYDSCDLSVCISFFKLLTFLIIQIKPANAIIQATPKIAPTAAPTTVVVFESLDGVAVTVDVTVAVAAASVEFEESEVVEVPGTTLLMNFPRYVVWSLSMIMVELLQQLVRSEASRQHHVSSVQGSTL